MRRPLIGRPPPLVIYGLYKTTPKSGMPCLDTNVQFTLEETFGLLAPRPSHIPTPSPAESPLASVVVVDKDVRLLSLSRPSQ